MRYGSGSGSFFHHTKNSKKNHDSYCFVTFYDFLSLKNDVNVVSLLPSGRSLTKIAGSGVGYGYVSVNQRYGSEDTNPDPYQNVTDPQL
jgi:hypothetical protein